MSTDKNVAIGVELAGRGASVALVDRRGRVRHRCNAKTLHGRPATATLEPYLRAIESMLACADAEGLRICGLGVCVPGSLDTAARRPLLIPTLPSLNDFPSMDAMQKMVQRALRRGEETSLKQRLLNREYFSPQLLAEEAVRGDSVALQVYSEVGRWLGAATARYISLFEPNILILGGGVLTASDLPLTQVRSALMTHSSSRVCSMVEVVPARLGSDAALLGAVVPLF